MRPSRRRLTSDNLDIHSIFVGKKYEAALPNAVYACFHYIVLSKKLQWLLLLPKWERWKCNMEKKMARFHFRCVVVITQSYKYTSSPAKIGKQVKPVFDRIGSWTFATDFFGRTEWEVFLRMSFGEWRTNLANGEQIRWI